MLLASWFDVLFDYIDIPIVQHHPERISSALLLRTTSPPGHATPTAPHSQRSLGRARGQRLAWRLGLLRLLVLCHRSQQSVRSQEEFG